MQQIQESITYIRTKTDYTPEHAIILGTGLGNLVNEMNIEYSINYEDIPHFPVSTVESHKGHLLFGTIGKKKVVAMQGRFHFYEGYNMKQVTFPVRVMKYLGAEKLFVSNVSGSLNPDIPKGTIMIIKDHIYLQTDNPLTGANDENIGPRFTDMSQPYNNEMIDKAMAIAKSNNINACTGVYVSVPGPNLETKAEYKYLRIIGGDAVGMSTVPEVIVGNHMGMPVFAISVITDEGFPEDLQPVAIEEIIAIAGESEPKMTTILKELIASV